MHKDHCQECGHLLSRNQDYCAFCGWRERIDDHLLWQQMEHQLLYPYPEQYRPEMLSAL